VKIEVLGIDGLSAAAEAWRLSRDVDKPVEWRDVFTVDSPCCEMPSAFCHFHDFTIIDRKIFASSRTHVMWARTSFVDSPEKYHVPGDLGKMIDAEVHRSLRAKMQMGKEAGLHQDEWRRFLPVSANTSFVMRLSYRDAIKMAKYFEYLSDISSVYLCDHFIEVTCELMNVVDMFTGSRQLSLEAKKMMSMPKLLHEGAVELAPIQNLGGVTVATFEVPVWIRAHIVRHRPITVADDFIRLLECDTVLDEQISWPVKMKIAASNDIWKALLGRRSCWLTLSTLSTERDPWEEIVSQFTGLFGTQMLPCADGSCPHHKDARNRLEGTDPGVVCPQFLSLNDVDMTPHRGKIEMALRSKSIFWKQMVQEKTGWLEESKQ